MELAGAGEKPAGSPWLTFGLLAALAAVFCCEVAFGLDPATGLLQPSVRTLAAMGGSNRTLVAGSGMALSPASAVSVGASGALMGLLATLFVVSFHFTPGLLRTRLQTAALQVLLPSLIPLATTVTGQHVDYGAHLGGVLGGTLMGLILLGNWPDTERLPRLRWLAAGIAAAGLIATLVTAAMVANSVIKLRHEVDLRAMLIPNSELPRTDAEMKSQVESLAARYPHDPRPRLFRGLAMLDAGDSAGAERELRAGLADAQIMKNLLPPRVEALLRTNLAMALYGNSQKAEARTIAAPVCRLDTAESRPMRVPLKSIGVCD